MIVNMKMNIEKLITRLSGLSEDELNTILDCRDTDPFDSDWRRLYDSVGGKETPPDADDIFFRISEATRQHEIASYIADDLDLIFRAEMKSVEDPFLRYLCTCYKEGEVPIEWKNV